MITNLGTQKSSNSHSLTDWLADSLTAKLSTRLTHKRLRLITYYKLTLILYQLNNKTNNNYLKQYSILKSIYYIYVLLML
jgi:hypothetical protein